MKNKYLFIILIAISILHILGVFGGFYAKGIRLDIIEHILFGVFLGILWTEFFGIEHKKSKLFFSILGFATFGSVLWETLEFIFLNFLPTFAYRFDLISLEAGEMLGDILSGLTGGVLFFFWILFRGKDL